MSFSGFSNYHCLGYFFIVFFYVMGLSFSYRLSLLFVLGTLLLFSMGQSLAEDNSFSQRLEELQAQMDQKSLSYNEYFQSSFKFVDEMCSNSYLTISVKDRKTGKVINNKKYCERISALQNELDKETTNLTKEVNNKFSKKLASDNVDVYYNVLDDVVKDYEKKQQYYVSLFKKTKDGNPDKVRATIMINTIESIQNYYRASKIVIEEMMADRKQKQQEREDKLIVQKKEQQNLQKLVKDLEIVNLQYINSKNFKRNFIGVSLIKGDNSVSCYEFLQKSRVLFKANEIAKHPLVIVNDSGLYCLNTNTINLTEVIDREKPEELPVQIPNDISIVQTPASDCGRPRVSSRGGKINQWYDTTSCSWRPEVEVLGSQWGGDEYNLLGYCKLHYPNTKSVIVYDMPETISTWISAKRFYTLTSVSFECKQ